MEYEIKHNYAVNYSNINSVGIRLACIKYFSKYIMYSPFNPHKDHWRDDVKIVLNGDFSFVIKNNKVIGFIGNIY